MCVSTILFVRIAGWGLSGPSVKVGPKSKNVCQPIKRRGARAPPRRSMGSAWPWPAGSKIIAEEWRAIVPRQIRPVRGSYQRVTKAVHRPLELDGHERLPGPVELPSPGQDVVDARLADEERQELMEDHPLVMPPGEPAGCAEHLVWRRAMVTLLHILHGLVMEEEEGGMEAGEHEVLIIARVGNDGGTCSRCGASLRRGPRTRS